jgi:very-short-patch-repair endonuclease
MPVPRIVLGQKVNEGKVCRAKELRREMTPTETLLWDRLRRSQLNGLHFRRQQVVRGFIADFYCHQAALVVEVDGSIHDGRQEADRERDAALAAAGFRTLRFTNHQVETAIENVLQTIAAAG